MTSVVALATLLYSASVLERDIVACFFEHQEIRLLPRYMQYPVVDFLSFTSEAQSASANSLIDKFLLLVSFNP